MDTKTQLSKPTVILHWLVAVVIIPMLIIGIYMEENEVYSLYPIHKSIGILLFVAVILRVLWRIKNGFPKAVSNYKKIEVITAKIVHWVLLIATLLFPLSGMMMSGAGGHGLYVFGFELLAANPDPNNIGEFIAINPTLAEMGHNMHSMLTNVVILAIVLHILGALKHHIIDKDSTLKRMLGKRV